MSFNTEKSYLLWDEEHDRAPVRFIREEGDSVVFNGNVGELVFEKTNVVNLGSASPPLPAAREPGNHYISTDDSGASNDEGTLPPSQEPWGTYNSQRTEGTEGSQATGANETGGASQSGGRRKAKGKKTKKARKSRKSKTKKTKKSKGKGKK